MTRGKIKILRSKRALYGRKLHGEVLCWGKTEVENLFNSKSKLYFSVIYDELKLFKIQLMNLISYTHQQQSLKRKAQEIKVNI